MRSRRHCRLLREAAPACELVLATVVASFAAGPVAVSAAIGIHPAVAVEMFDTMDCCWQRVLVHVHLATLVLSKSLM